MSLVDDRRVNRLSGKECRDTLLLPLADRARNLRRMARAGPRLPQSSSAIEEKNRAGFAGGPFLALVKEVFECVPGTAATVLGHRQGARAVLARGGIVIADFLHVASTIGDVVLGGCGICGAEGPHEFMADEAGGIKGVAVESLRVDVGFRTVCSCRSLTDPIQDH